MQRQRGFTLVEVLVALSIMAMMAALAWSGIDSLLKSRESAQVSVERSTRLQTVMAQWDQDLTQLQDTQIVPTLDFDGRALRMTRRSPSGVQVVVWWVEEGRWYRWASEPVTNVPDLLRAHERGQQSTTLAGQALATIVGVSGWQLAYFRGNAWTNALSSGDLEAAADTAAKDAANAANPNPGAPGNPGAGGNPGTPGAPANPGAPGAPGTPGAPNAAPPPSDQRIVLPAGIRLRLEFDGSAGVSGALTYQTVIAGGA